MIEVLLTCYTKDVLTKYIKFINHFNSNISFLTPTFLLLSVQSGRERERLYLLYTVYCTVYCFGRMVVYTLQRKHREFKADIYILSKDLFTVPAPL